MTNLQRFANLAFGLAMIACGLVLLLNPEGGMLVVACVLGLALVLYGVKKLFYYVTMARHMTSGLTVLFIAMVALDFGVFTTAFTDNPRFAIALFVIAYNAITGILAIARGVESKLFGSPWAMNVLHGLANLALASLCFTFYNSTETVISVLCVDLFYNAGVRIASAFKPSEIVYIQ